MSKRNREILNTQTKLKFEAIKSYSPNESAIADLNEAFHESYNLLIHEMQQKLGQADTPVIIMFREHVTLLHDGRKETVKVIPALYHQLKAISHVSFGVYVSLAANGYGPLRDDIREDLERKQGLIEKALSILDEEDIPANHIDTQRRTLEYAQAFLGEVLASGQVEKDRMRRFGRQNAPLYLENAAVCVMLELDVLHRTVMKWKEQMGPENWDRVHVIICAAHQARYREATKQYFQRLLREEEGVGAQMEARVVFGEHLQDIDAALELLARHIVDQRSSVDLFESRTRLQEDLMSEGAAAYLERLLPH